MGGRKWAKKRFSINGRCQKAVALPGSVFIVLCHGLFCYIMHQADPTPQTLPQRPLSASARGPGIGQQGCWAPDQPLLGPPGSSWVLLGRAGSGGPR